MTSSLDNLIQLLGWTLDPHFTKQATLTLESMKSQNGFLRNLIMIIQDNNRIPFQIRFSAIVYLKNTIQESTNPSSLSYTKPLVNKEDYEFAKHTLLEFMTIITKQKEQKLLEIMKQICFFMIRNEYRERNNWDDLVNKLVDFIKKCENEETIKVALIISKILFNYLGKSLTEEGRLNSLANKIILPLIGLGEKMYASLESEFSCSEFIEILRIFTDAIEFHLPEIIEKNIHQFMILVKNLLTMRVYSPLTLIDNGFVRENYEKSILLIKLNNEALIFLEKLYQRHATSNLLSLKKFVKEFNSNYTKVYFEIIINIIMEEPFDKIQQQLKQQYKQHHLEHYQQKIHSLTYELGNHALSIFSFIASNKESSKYILEELDKCEMKILYISIERFLSSRESSKLNRILNDCESKSISEFENNNNSITSIEKLSSQLNTTFQNYTDFTEIINEERLPLRLFISTIFSNKNIPNRKKHIEEILELLVKCIVEGSLKEKELGIYLLSSLEKEIELLTDDSEFVSNNTKGEQEFCVVDMNKKMTFILESYIYPLLLSTFEASTLSTSINTNVMETTTTNDHYQHQIQQSHIKNIIEQSIYTTLIRLRCYELYARFEYLELTKEHSIKLCEQIYLELSKPFLNINNNNNNNNKFELFTKIQCMETFNLILSEHEEMIPLLANNAKNIIIIYTQLLEKEYEVIRFFDEILLLFSPYIMGEMVYEILDLLANMYESLSAKKMIKNNNLSTNYMDFCDNKFINNERERQEELYEVENSSSYSFDNYDDNENNEHNDNNNSQESEEETVYDDRQNKYDNIGMQCLSAIKKLLYKHELVSLVNYSENITDNDNNHNSYSWSNNNNGNNGGMQDNTTTYVNNSNPSITFHSLLLLADKLTLIALNTLTTRDQSLMKEGLAIMNLLLYRQFVTDKYTNVFLLFVYPTILMANNNRNCDNGYNSSGRELREGISKYFSLQESTGNNNNNEIIENVSNQSNQSNQLNQSNQSNQLNSKCEQPYVRYYNQILSQIIHHHHHHHHHHQSIYSSNNNHNNIHNQNNPFHHHEHEQELSQLQQFITTEYQEHIFELTEIICIVKNSIKLFGSRLGELKCSFTGRSYLELLMQMVEIVFGHSSEYENERYLNSFFNSNNNNSEKITILGVYEAMVENQVFGHAININNNNHNDVHNLHNTTNTTATNQHLHELITNVFSLTRKLLQSQSQSMIQQEKQEHGKNKLINNVTTQLESTTILNLTMLLSYYYPEQLYSEVHREAVERCKLLSEEELSMIFHKKEQELFINNIVNVVNEFIVNRIELIIKPLNVVFGNLLNKHQEHEQEKQEANQQVPIESFVVVKGLARFSCILVDKLVFNNTHNQPIPQSLIILFRKLSYILNKLSIQICYSAFKEALGEEFETEIENNELGELKSTFERINFEQQRAHLDKNVVSGNNRNNNEIVVVGDNNRNNNNNKVIVDKEQQEYEEYERESMMLAQMFNCLNINTSGGVSLSNNNNSYYNCLNNNNKFSYNNEEQQHEPIVSNPYYHERPLQQPQYESFQQPQQQPPPQLHQHSQQFEQNYQNHLNIAKELNTQKLYEEFEEEIYNETSNESSSITNPFEKFDEEYLLKYDSEMTHVLREKNKKLKLLHLLEEIMQIQVDKRIFYLKEIFEQSLRSRKRHA